MIQKKTFNDPLLPKHLDKNTIYGIITKSMKYFFFVYKYLKNCYNIYVIVFVKAKLSAGDVIFPNKSNEENDIEEKKGTELYKISHHTFGIGEQLNRKLVLIRFCLSS